MIFVAIFMMPFYYGSKAHSVPGFLKLRYNEATRGFNAISFAVLTLLTSGINMYAAALVFNVLLGGSLNASIWVAAVFIMAYILLGGLTSSIYNETLQFFLIVAGLLPLTIVGLINVGGWSGLQAKVHNPAFFHLWTGTATNNNPFGVNFISIAPTSSAMPRPSLLTNGSHCYCRRCCTQRRHGLSCIEFQQYHGLRTSLVLHLQCAIACHLPARHVLATYNLLGWLLGLTHRHNCFHCPLGWRTIHASFLIRQFGRFQHVACSNRIRDLFRHNSYSLALH